MRWVEVVGRYNRNPPRGARPFGRLLRKAVARPIGQQMASGLRPSYIRPFGSTPAETPSREDCTFGRCAVVPPIPIPILHVIRAFALHQQPVPATRRRRYQPILLPRSAACSSLNAVRPDPLRDLPSTVPRHRLPALFSPLLCSAILRRLHRLTYRTLKNGLPRST